MSTWVLDRFEGGLAVLEHTETRETAAHERSALPHGAKEGDVLHIDDHGTIAADEVETENRAQAIRARFDRLKNRGKK